MAGPGVAAARGPGRLMLGVGRAGPLGPRGAHEPTDGTRSGDGVAPAGAGGQSQPRLDADRDARIVLAATNGIGPQTYDRLVAAAGSARRVLELAAGSGGDRRLRDAWVAAALEPGLLTRPAVAAVTDAANRATDILAAIGRAGLTVVTRDDRDFPDRLRWIDGAPVALFVRGSVRALSAERSVAVVGTRRPSRSGRITAARIAAALVRADAVVVSGLAVGIDGAAHEAAVAAGGRTVAVIGSGHDRLFPSIHARLADAIVAADGAVVSEYGPGTEPTKGTFPRRNRLISGLASAVVVVEAGARSGALLTAAWALEQGRECFLVPGAIDAPQSIGCLAFLREWPGLARIVAGIPQLLEDLGLPGAAALSGGATRPADARATDHGPEAVVAGAIAAGAETVDELVAVTGLPLGRVLGALTRLESAGLVVGSVGVYRAAGPLATGAERVV